MRPFLRFVASILTVSGILLLADAATTLVWQEPISFISAQRQQQNLKASLERPPPRVRERKPLKGDAIGRIRLPTLGRSYYLVEGTEATDLRRGPGHYDDTPMPGERGTVGIAGHRTTYGAPFRTIDKLKPGQQVILDMTYGRYVYRVQKTLIVDPTELSVKRPVGYERLILSACHPLYSAAERIVVFAKLAQREPSRVKRGVGYPSKRSQAG